ncbi:MAG: uracil-DNA glycosylase [Anaerotignaceae bacterium]
MAFIQKDEQYYVNKYPNNKLVFGEGRKNAKIFIIGEAPGGEEEKQGRPFVGKAGKNLDEFLKIAGVSRSDVYITNTVKLRPTKTSLKTGKAINRPPFKGEIEDFIPLLMDELSTIKPRLVVTLGNVPLKAVTADEKITIGSVHGKLLQVHGIRLFPLYHPAAVIYNQSLRQTYMEDLQAIKDYL